MVESMKSKLTRWMEFFSSRATTRFCSLFSNLHEMNEKTLSKILLKHVVFHCTFFSPTNSMGWSIGRNRFLNDSIKCIFRSLFVNFCTAQYIKKRTRYRKEMPGECGIKTYRHREAHIHRQKQLKLDVCENDEMNRVIQVKLKLV